MGDNGLVERLEFALLGDAHRTHVDMVLSADETSYRAASRSGTVTFRREITNDTTVGGYPTGQYRFVIDTVTGTNPLANDHTDRFIGIEAEAAAETATPETNAYPYAYEQIAQFFDAQHAPEAVVQHSPQHFIDEHLGQHGSLNLVQARAPFFAAGPGIPQRVRLDTHCRMVDVAPTIAATLGLTPHPHGLGPTGQPRSEALLARQDGHQLEGFGSAEHARRALVILLDGVNANALYGAITRGLAPTLASLMERGTTFNHGVLASFPTATLANHTTANTGAHPGHTGILHHTWLDRDRDVVPDLLKTDEMFDPMRYLRPEVETLHEAIHRCRPDSFTTAAFEFCDRGADASSFGQIRTHGRPGLPDATELADATQRFVAESRAYAFMSAVDELATRQTVDWWTQREGNPIPTFSWLSLSLTDEAGHVYGPHSGAVDAAIIDSDRRVARVLNGIERTGALADTAVFVFADHGMQRCNPAHGGSWADTLLSTSLAVRDVGQGLLYSRHLPSSNIDHSGD